MTMHPPPVLTVLRSATAPHHARLEARLDIRHRLASRDGYAALLATMLGVVGPLEAALDRFDWPGTGLEADAARWRAPLIEADLRHLGLPGAAIAALPRSAALPALPSRDAAFGALYVLEGSALGGQLILRQAREALGVEPGAGASFYGAHGRPPVGEGWRAFRIALERHCADAAAAASAAADSFRLLHDWVAATLPGGAEPDAGARMAAA